MKLRTLLPILFLVTPVLAKEPDIEKYSAQVARFVVDVCYSPAKGDTRKIFRRLPSEYSLSVQTKDAAFERVIREKIGKMASITGHKEKNVEAGKEPLITVYAGSFSELKPIANKADRSISLDSGYSSWAWWDIDETVTKGVIFICLDKLDQAKREQLLNHGLMFMWGVTSQSDEISQSSLYEGGSISTLQPIDIRLLKFLYTYVPTKTKPAQLRDLIRDNWEKVKN